MLAVGIKLLTLGFDYDCKELTSSQSLFRSKDILYIYPLHQNNADLSDEGH